MSLLTLIQDAALKTGVDVPTVVIGNLDLGCRELLTFAQEEGRELVKRGDWRMLRKESVYVTLAAEEQTGFFPANCDHIVSDTMWNRSKRRPVYGPVTPQEWQAIKSITTSPIMDTVYIRGSSALLTPVPPAGQNIAFEYVSKYFCQSAGSVAQASWTADTDTGILDENLMCLGVIVRYKMSKGLDATSDMAKYETQVQQYLTQDQPSRTIDLGGIKRRGPGVVIPEGSFTH